MKRSVRNAGAEKQFHDARGEQRRLLGRLGNRGIAREQSGGHLAGKDRHRKVPGADAHEHALAVQRDFVVLAGGPGQHLGLGKMAPCHLRVVAAEISRLTHFVDAVDQRLAGLAHAQCHQLGPIFLEQVGHALQAFGALDGRRCVPIRLRLQRGIHGAPGAFRVGKRDRADQVVVIGRRADLRGFHRLQFPVTRRTGLPTRRPEPRHLLGQILLLGFGIEVDTARIAPLTAKDIDRQRNTGVRELLEPLNQFDRVGNHLARRQLLVDDPVDKRTVGPVFKQPADQIR